MLSRKRKNENNVIGPSTGWMKWINRFFRFILYPFIHPKAFVILLVLVLAAVIVWPISQGVQPEDLKKWYGEKYNQYSDVVRSHIAGSYLEKIIPDKKKINDNVAPVVRPKFEAPKQKMADYKSPQKNRRKAFQKVEINKDKQNVEVRKRVSSSYNGPDFKRNNSLDLNYLENPRKVSGVLEVVNANEVMLGARRLFLYGIYVPPSSDKGLNAEIFLRKNYGGKNVDCYIGAYAKSGQGTAICVIDGININQKLVDAGFSQNVSLF